MQTKDKSFSWKNTAEIACPWFPWFRVLPVHSDKSWKFKKKKKKKQWPDWLQFPENLVQQSKKI